ncbi:MAG: hypothetical protein GXP33_15595 [Spirochaetes bacterium]|nr:hypothetical protein [Spirochaetota bacterium]
MNDNDIDTAKYLEDIRTIKELLLKTEDQPVYENWAFYAWGILIISAGIVHYFAEAAYKLGTGELFLKIWLPAIFIGGIYRDRFADQKPGKKLLNDFLKNNF